MSAEFTIMFVTCFPDGTFPVLPSCMSKPSPPCLLLPAQFVYPSVLFHSLYLLLTALFLHLLKRKIYNITGFSFHLDSMCTWLISVILKGKRNHRIQQQNIFYVHFLEIEHLTKFMLIDGRVSFQMCLWVLAAVTTVRCWKGLWGAELSHCEHRISLNCSRSELSPSPLPNSQRRHLETTTSAWCAPVLFILAEQKQSWMPKKYSRLSSLLKFDKAKK